MKDEAIITMINRLASSAMKQAKSERKQAAAHTTHRTNKQSKYVYVCRLWADESDYTEQVFNTYKQALNYHKKETAKNDYQFTEIQKRTRKGFEFVDDML